MLSYHCASNELLAICLNDSRLFRGAGNTLGQDLNLSLDRVLASRNFANKLWNAGKFIDFNLAQVWLPEY